MCLSSRKWRIEYLVVAETVLDVIIQKEQNEQALHVEYRLSERLCG